MLTRLKIFYTSILVALAIATSLWLTRQPSYHSGCLQTDGHYVICAASSMARFSRREPIVLEHPDFDISDKTIDIVAARNESVAFQVLLKRLSAKAPTEYPLSVQPWVNEIGEKAQTLTSEIFQAHYHWVENGGYQWGPDSTVLEWPAYYPDALVPQRKDCAGSSKSLFNSISLSKKPFLNQSIWIDTFIPATIAAGMHETFVVIGTKPNQVKIKVRLHIADATLPDKPSITALGEIYRAYRVEGVGESRDTKKWRALSYCYQQLAHQHRMVFIERTPEVPQLQAWSNYLKTVKPILSGELFTSAYNYRGTGIGTPPSIWRTPWPQEFDVELAGPLSASDRARYRRYAKQWAKTSEELGWQQTKFFAYIFDEVDGPSYDRIKDRDYLRMVHNEMALLQSVLDEASPVTPIDLLWTSHSNPARWQEDPELDLTGKIRLWAPNASAADPHFLGKRISRGDTAWFYHSGHPAVGTHSINSSGIEMRTWGVIAARYNFQGQFMWAVNLGSDERPFAEPSYKPDDDRFGNGVMLYPGNQLNKIGYPKAPGPIPSMRLKAWRRGLQDAELYFLAKSNNPVNADELLNQMIPQALAIATGEAKWPRDPARWIDFRKALITLASEEDNK